MRVADVEAVDLLSVSTDQPGLEGFELCCVIRRFGRSSGTNYRFEVMIEPTVLAEAALFAHYATGPRQRRTDFNPMPGYAVDLAAGGIAIICTIR